MRRMSKSSLKFFIVGEATETWMERLGLAPKRAPRRCHAYTTAIRHQRHGEWTALCWVYNEPSLNERDEHYVNNCDAFIVTVSEKDDAERLVRRWSRTIRAHSLGNPCMLIAYSGLNAVDEVQEIACAHQMDYVWLPRRLDPDAQRRFQTWIKGRLASMAFHVVPPCRVPRLLTTHPSPQKTTCDLLNRWIRNLIRILRCGSTDYM